MIHLWRGKDAGAASREPLKVQPAWRPAARGLSSAPGRNAMATAEIKTKATDVSVADFIAAVPDARPHEEAAIVDAIDPRIDRKSVVQGTRVSVRVDISVRRHIKRQKYII